MFALSISLFVSDPGYNLAYSQVALLSLLAAIALKQYFIKRDNTLRRLLELSEKATAILLNQIRRFSMKLKSLLAGMVIALFSLSAMSADYEIDVPGQHAFVSFKASHLGYSYIMGGFNKFEGAFSHDADNPSASKANVTIDTSSLDTNHAERDTHLRGEEFLDVDNHPTITFTSTGYSGDGSSGKLEGDLTLHGVTKSIEIDVKHIGEDDDPWGGYRSGFAGTVDLNASDYGLPDWVGVLQVELNVEGTRM